MAPHALLSLLLLTAEPSRWVRRTARRRQRTEALLSSIPLPPGVSSWETKVLHDAPAIDWEKFPALLDPQRGGKLRRGTPRALRKRRAVEAFVYLSRGLLMGDGSASGSEQCECCGVIVDAASGAGNLSIPLSGLLGCKTTVLAIDVNEVALHRLKERDASVKVLCADLAADIDLERFGASMVVSLHGCGAATDMAIRLATRNRLPFVVSPCCTAKAVVGRTYGPQLRATAGIGSRMSSEHRSGAPSDIVYPRSTWLASALTEHLNGNDDIDGAYATIAKVADGEYM